jgi:hypothetical protein
MQGNIVGNSGPRSSSSSERCWRSRHWVLQQMAHWSGACLSWNAGLASRRDATAVPRSQLEPQRDAGSNHDAESVVEPECVAKFITEPFPVSLQAPSPGYPGLTPSDRRAACSR